MSPEHIWRWSLPLHHVMSEDGYSAGFQQPSAPLDGASLTHTRKAQIDSLLPTAPSVKVDTCGIRTADPCPLARTLPPLGRWSGSFSHGVSFLGRELQGPTFQ